MVRNDSRFIRPLTLNDNRAGLRFLVRKRTREYLHERTQKKGTHR